MIIYFLVGTGADIGYGEASKLLCVEYYMTYPSFQSDGCGRQDRATQNREETIINTKV